MQTDFDILKKTFDIIGIGYRITKDDDNKSIIIWAKHRVVFVFSINGEYKYMLD